MPSRERLPSVGFIGWNPFQLRHASPLAKVLPNSVFLVEARAEHPFSFATKQLDGASFPSLIWPKSRIRQLDGVFDVIVCQNEFEGIEDLEHTKVAMLQYGLAKEPHNYGAWRSLGDLQLAYGEYSARRLRHYSPAVAVGNPALDRWHEPGYRELTRALWSKRMDLDRPTIAYAPTWGPLSTVEQFVDAVAELSTEYNVLLKLHHNTALLEGPRRDSLRRPGVLLLGQNEELLDVLCVADVVLSDYSGAIFDAAYCRRPVVLLHQNTEGRFGAKLDAQSIEYSLREQLGTVVSDPSLLSDVVADALRNPRLTDETLLADLFVPGPGAAERAAQAVIELAKGECPGLDQTQQYVRTAVGDLRRTRSELRKKKATGASADRPSAAKKKRGRPKGFYTKAAGGLAHLEARALTSGNKVGWSRGVLTYARLRSKLSPSLATLKAGMSSAEALGHWSAAEDLADVALQKYPDNSGGYVGKARILALQGNYAEAQKVLLDAPAKVRRYRTFVDLNAQVANRVLNGLPARNKDRSNASREAQPSLNGAASHERTTPSAKPIAKRLSSITAPFSRTRGAGLPVKLVIAVSEACEEQGRLEDARRELLLAQRSSPAEHRLLMRIADLYRDDAQPEVAYVYYKAAAAVRHPYGSVRKLCFESDQGFLDEGARTLANLLSLSPQSLLPFMPMLNRVALFYPQLAEAMTQLRAQTRECVIEGAYRNARTCKERIEIALNCRWMPEVLLLIGEAEKRGLALDKHVLDRVAKVRTSLGPLVELLEAAWHNEHSSELLCWREGNLEGFDEDAGAGVVEFFIPTAFFAFNNTEKPTYETVRAMFRVCFEYICEQPGMRVIPRLQLNWRNCVPKTGAHVLSYHTHGTDEPRFLRIQESTIAGRCSADSAGFAGFASIANNAVVRSEVQGSSSASATLRALRNYLLTSNTSKYHQPDDFETVSGPYVFVPLQITTDVVAELGYLDALTMLRVVTEFFDHTPVKVVVKRHPYCRSITIERELARLARQHLVIVARGSIHSLLGDCKAVITVNSGVGLEALLHGKPVIVTGACDYAQAATVCRDIDGLRQALGDLDALKDRNEQERESFLEYYCTQYAHEPKLGQELVHRLDRWLAAPRQQESQQPVNERADQVVGPLSM